MSSEEEFPRELSVDEDKHDDFERLSKMDEFKLSDAPMKSVFLYSLALGWSTKQRIPLKKRNRSIPSRLFTPEEKWLLYAIAFVETNDINIILDKRKVVEIAEEYANGGIDRLVEIIYNPHDERDIYIRLQEDILKKI